MHKCTCTYLRNGIYFYFQVIGKNIFARRKYFWRRKSFRKHNLHLDLQKLWHSLWRVLVLGLAVVRVRKGGRRGEGCGQPLVAEAGGRGGHGVLGGRGHHHAGDGGGVRGRGRGGGREVGGGEEGVWGVLAGDAVQVGGHLARLAEVVGHILGGGAIISLDETRFNNRVVRVTTRRPRLATGSGV